MKNQDHFFDKGLVSIIMLSHGDSTYVVETAKSVLAQTYQNSCVPMVLGQAKRQGRAASAASVERGIVVCGKNE